MAEPSSIPWVVVTGASRGLGLAIAQHLLAHSSWRVLALSRTLSPDLAALKETHPQQVQWQQADLADLDAIHPLARTITHACRPLYGLVNNAAIGHSGMLATQHDRDIAELITVNLHAPILLSKYLLRPMLSNGAGRLITITSIAAARAYKGLAVYAATKAGLEAFTRTLAREVGPAGITVNAVAPGFMPTAMTSGLTDEQLAAIQRRAALPERAAPDDIAATTAWLLSPAAAHITATTLTVDAGAGA
jgi:3-oxoacyl-[acyl-carrier protein] reductase